MSEHQYVVCDYRAVFEKSYMTPPGSVAFFVSRNVIAMVDPNKDDEDLYFHLIGQSLKKIS